MSIAMIETEFYCCLSGKTWKSLRHKRDSRNFYLKF